MRLAQLRNSLRGAFFGALRPVLPNLRTHSPIAGLPRRPRRFAGPGFSAALVAKKEAFRFTFLG